MSGSVATPVLVLEPIPENLLREPIDYLFAEHYRQRQVLDALEGFFGEAYFERDLTGPWRAVVATVVGYLENEFALHIGDEESDLFSVLRDRCAGDDSCTAVLRQLAAEHQDEPVELRALVAGLKQLLAGRKPADSMGFLNRALRFIQAQRHHLIWENNVVLPMARKHLTEEDLQQIGRHMAQRHGVAFPP